MLWVCVAGKKMLVPLTASLYASGTLANTNTVLVDVGTGYYIEVREMSAQIISSYLASSRDRASV